MWELLRGTDASGAVYIKANNTTYIGDDRVVDDRAGVPTIADLAQFDSTVTTATATNTVTLDANQSWSWINLTNPGGAITIGGTGTLTLGTVTLTGANHEYLPGLRGLSPDATNGSITITGPEPEQ